MQQVGSYPASARPGHTFDNPVDEVRNRPWASLGVRRARAAATLAVLAVVGLIAQSGGASTTRSPSAPQATLPGAYVVAPTP